MRFWNDANQTGLPTLGTSKLAKRIVRVSSDDSLRALRLIGEVLDTGEYCLEIVADSRFLSDSDIQNEDASWFPDTALVLTTSGSTGRPKRIELSPSALRAAAQASAAAIGTGQWLLILPINYIAGASILVRSVLADTEPVILTGSAFTPDTFLEAVSRMDASKPHFLSLVPVQLRRLADRLADYPDLLHALRSFEAILVGGQSVDKALLQEMRDLGIRLIESYGLTETAGGFLYDGVPLQNMQVRADNQGILQVSGPQLAEGLDAWFTTSDLAELQDGRWKILGRADRVVNSGGLKVSLDLVEETVRQVSGVEDCAALALDDSVWGQRVGLLVTGSVTTNLSDLLRKKLGPAAEPTRLLFIPNLPRLSSGKPDYPAARDFLLS